MKLNLGEVLPYEQHVRIMEFLILLAFAPIEAIRISWGNKCFSKKLYFSEVLRKFAFKLKAI